MYWMGWDIQMMLSKIRVNPFHCPMFIAALFTITKTWKKLKCPLTDDWIKKIRVCVCVCVCVRAMVVICIFICNGLLLSHKKLYNAICSNMLLLLSHFSHVQLCATPQMAAHQAPPSLGFSRQEHWSGLLFPSMLESEKWKWSRSVESNSSPPHGLQPTRQHRWI